MNLSSPSWGHTPCTGVLGAGVFGVSGKMPSILEPTPIRLHGDCGLADCRRAELNAQDHEGETPLDQAIEGGSAETVALLKKHGAKTRKELKAEKPDSGGKFEDYYAAGLRIRFRESWLVTERDELPWKGYGVVDGYPETVLQSLDVSDVSDTYSLPPAWSTTRNPRRSGRSQATRKTVGALLINEDGEGGYHAFFQVDPLEHRPAVRERGQRGGAQGNPRLTSLRKR